MRPLCFLTPAIVYFGVSWWESISQCKCYFVASGILEVQDRNTFNFSWPFLCLCRLLTHGRQLVACIHPLGSFNNSKLPPLVKEIIPISVDVPHSCNCLEMMVSLSKSSRRQETVDMNGNGSLQQHRDFRPATFPVMECPLEQELSKELIVFVHFKMSVINVHLPSAYLGDFNYDILQNIQTSSYANF